MSRSIRPGGGSAAGGRREPGRRARRRRGGAGGETGVGSGSVVDSLADAVTTEALNWSMSGRRETATHGQTEPLDRTQLEHDRVIVLVHRRPCPLLARRRAQIAERSLHGPRLPRSA